jgi:PKD repeat protein/formylmethanofuran dehydrogenase subunit D
MNHIYKKLTPFATLLLCFLSMASYAQIFEPEGINMPGTWNGFTNPPLEGSALGSELQVNGGVKLETFGVRRYTTTLHCADEGDFPAGNYSFLFTSGPQASAFQNKWANVNVTPNVVQAAFYQGANDNNIETEDNSYYTVNFQDNGYANTFVSFLLTSQMPSAFVSVGEFSATQNPGEAVNITATLDMAPSADQYFYIRYSTDDFENSIIVSLTVNGTELSGTIPGIAANSTVKFYLFSSSRSGFSEPNYDMLTLRYINDEGDYFTYNTGEEEPELEDFLVQLNICSEDDESVLNAGGGFDSYLWNTEETTASITVTGAGTFTVEFTSGNQSATGTFVINLVSSFTVDLGENITQCSNNPVVLSFETSLDGAADSLTIRYDATQGQTGLVGAEKVYYHSGIAFTPMGAWSNSVGNWGQDDGVGEMYSVGENLWEIKINPQSYYGLNAGQTWAGFYMVFRNANGTAEGKDENGANIYLNAVSVPAYTSTFSGITAIFEASDIASIMWSNGESGNTITVTESGTYSVTITDANGCSASDSVVVNLIEVPAIDLGEDIFLCNIGSDIMLDAGEGFDSYLWSTGATTQTISVSLNEGEELTISVAATINQICEATDTIKIVVNEFALNVNLGNDTSICSNSFLILDSGVELTLEGDSLTIRYDATKGQTGLVGAEKVYYHSGVAFTPLGPWSNGVGNWGQDDGIGEMYSIGENLWEIKFNPQEYYGLLPNQTWSGFYMVFRNADGTAEGKDENGNDIYLNAIGVPPYSSTFTGVTAQFDAAADVNIITWSTGESTSTINVTESGTYWVEIANVSGCTVSDTIVVNVFNVPDLNLGENIAICADIINIVLDAGEGFDSYLWSNEATSQSIVADAYGTYSVVATTVEGCTATDAITISSNIFDGVIDLGEDRFICGTAEVTLNSGIYLSPDGDSLTIIYDATQGQSGLVGASKVYMHSSYELEPFGGSVLPWVGNWGEDDGLGEMTALGNNKWTITIFPPDYYNFPVGTNINGLFMVFRNANGTAEGKDNSGNDIFLLLADENPSSTFGGVTASWEMSPFVSILWSTGAETPSITVNTPGTYTVTASTEDGCTAVDTIIVSFGQPPVISLGQTQTICQGDSVVLDPGEGYLTYQWLSGETTQTITVSSGGTYQVTVSNAPGCEASAFVSIIQLNNPVASFISNEVDGLTVNFTAQATGGSTYSWDFNGDGTEDFSSNSPLASFTYSSPGNYNVTLTVTNACDEDETSANVVVIGVGLEDFFFDGLSVYPNPATDLIQLDFNLKKSEQLLFSIFSVDGKLVATYSSRFSAGKSVETLNVSQLPSGLYILEIANNEKRTNRRFVKR